jgi:hypothetical protein
VYDQVLMFPRGRCEGCLKWSLKRGSEVRLRTKETAMLKVLMERGA